MVDVVGRITVETGQLEIGQAPSPLSVEPPDAQTGRPIVERVLEVDGSAASGPLAVDENDFNQRRMEALGGGFTAQLLSMIREVEFEYGVDTKTDMLVRDQMHLNALATKSWLNARFIESFAKPDILVGLLRIIARLDYLDVYPEGPTMAVAALCHSDSDVQECGIRAFESWATLQSLRVLENVSASNGWLQDYVNQVVSDLREEHSVPIGQED